MDAETQWEESLDHLVTDAVARILAQRSPDFPAFLASMHQAVASLPADDALALDAGRRRSYATGMAFAIWNATPIPSRRFQPAPVRLPGRNDACPCGSGAKYKRCCANAPPLPSFDPDELLDIVLDQVSAEDIERAFRDHLLPPWVTSRIAQKRLDAEDAAGALALLEPIFEGPAADLRRLDERYQPALEALFDSYDALGYDDEKAAALERLGSVLRPPLRAEIWIHQAMTAADELDLDAATALFERAHRDDPYHETLPAAEMAVFLAAGDAERLRERARHWAGVLRREGETGADGPLAHFESIVSDPERAILLWAIAPELDPELVERFLDAVRVGISRPVPTLTLVRASREEAMGPSDFVVPPGSDELLAAWREAWPFPPEGEDEDEGLEAIWTETYAPAAWLSVLEKHPEAFDDLAILDDLLDAVLGLPSLQGFAGNRVLALPIARRGRAMIERMVAAAAQREHCSPRLPWRYPENRPALGILSEEAEVLGEDDAEYKTPLRLLAELDPDDMYSATDRLFEVELEEEGLDVGGDSLDRPPWIA